MLTMLVLQMLTVTMSTTYCLSLIVFVLPESQPELDKLCCGVLCCVVLCSLNEFELKAFSSHWLMCVVILQ